MAQKPGRKPRSLVGLRFGYYEVLREGERRGFKRYWVCRCDCGNEREVLQAVLMHSPAPSCGCKQNRKQPLLVEQKDAVIERYQRGESVEAIAAVYDCSNQAVRTILIKSGVERRDRNTAAVATILERNKEETELIKRLYTDESKSTVDIARIVGLTPGAVYSRLKTAGVPLRSVKEAISVGVSRIGSLAPNWKGGRQQHSRGYVYVYMPTHSNSNKQGYVFEHRLVMEAHLGRFLDPTEVIHHKNGNKSDNRIENLELTTRRDHVQGHFKDVERVAALQQENADLRARVAELEALIKKEKA